MIYLAVVQSLTWGPPDVCALTIPDMHPSKLWQGVPVCDGVWVQGRQTKPAVTGSDESGPVGHAHDYPTDADVLKVGDTVLVDFLHGVSSFPIMVGRLR